ncbi:hypothetical protein, partial [Micromonospora sp. CB01531]|uniref:hypothetical protein n=1 Tax=Micromonospora sp. CB01531 TaxID=1718947 RepID=UPI001A7E13B9
VITRLHNTLSAVIAARLRAAFRSRSRTRPQVCALVGTRGQGQLGFHRATCREGLLEGYQRSAITRRPPFRPVLYGTCHLSADFTEAGVGDAPGEAAVAEHAGH